jgi:hypothetical protein
VAEEKKEPETVSVTFSVPVELHKLLLEEAEAEDRNLSQQVKRIIRLYYEKKKPVYRGDK